MKARLIIEAITKARGKSFTHFGILLSWSLSLMPDI